jgi:hypothetical protein
MWRSLARRAAGDLGAWARQDPSADRKRGARQVPADEAVAMRLLADAGRHVQTATAVAATGDLAGAYQLAYDAFRKSAASLLAAQGLRTWPTRSARQRRHAAPQSPSSITASSRLGDVSSGGRPTVTFPPGMECVHVHDSARISRRVLVGASRAFPRVQQDIRMGERINRAVAERGYRARGTRHSHLRLAEC